MKIIAAALFSIFALTPLYAAEQTISLEALSKAAVENSPEIKAARDMHHAARARVAQARTLEQPQIVAEFNSIPEGSLSTGEAAEKMYGVNQMIPFPGKLFARGKTAKYEAQSAEWSLRDTTFKVLEELKSAYAEYYYTSKAIESYNETAQIMKSFSSIAESRYASGNAVQSDVLRAQVEAEKMTNMAITLEQEKESIKAEINRIVGKSADEELGQPAELKTAALKESWEDIKQLVMANSPDVRRQEANVSRAQWRARSSRLDYLPDLEVAYRRRSMDDAWMGSDLMVGVSVPLWFWKQSASVKEMSAEFEAAKSEKRSAELSAVAGARETYTRIDAARRLIDLYKASILPKSEQSLKSAIASYTGGKLGSAELLDSVRVYLDFKLEYHRYLADYRSSMAALERIAGKEFPGGAQ